MFSSYLLMDSFIRVFVVVVVVVVVGFFVVVLFLFGFVLN